MINELQLEWDELLNSNEGEKLKKIINIDGKTMRVNGRNRQRVLHIVTVYSKTDGVYFGQKIAEKIIKKKELLCLVGNCFHAFVVESQNLGLTELFELVTITSY